MFLRTIHAAVVGAAALISAQGLSSAATAEPASSECATLQQAEADLSSGLDDLKSHAGSLGAALALGPDDPDRLAAAEILRSMANSLQEASSDITTPAYRTSLEDFSAFLDNSAQILLGEGDTSPADMKKMKEQGEDLGNSVDTAYAHACNGPVSS